ncbi:hypothetical protein SAZ11_58215 [Streptomyces sp. FXJ1.4098]|nr:hypothetical protein [Streptomyces sp. FXJ1.4098]
MIYRPYTSVNRREGSERVALVIKGARSKGEACRLADDLAGSAAAALPPV